MVAILSRRDELDSKMHQSTSNNNVHFGYCVPGWGDINDITQLGSRQTMFEGGRGWATRQYLCCWRVRLNSLRPSGAYMRQ